MNVESCNLTFMAAFYYFYIPISTPNESWRSELLFVWMNEEIFTCKSDVFFFNFVAYNYVINIISFNLASFVLFCLFLQDFLTLGHAADQTEFNIALEGQGKGFIQISYERETYSEVA